jgi:dihydroorotate dehydrogenase
MLYRRAVRPTLFNVVGRDPERIHERVLRLLGWISQHERLTRALATALAIRYPGKSGPGHDFFGLHFPSRIGLAAGFDKNAVAVPALAALGFGFIEVGTVTPYAQSGNSGSRLFRLVKDQSLVNRMGFNNEGAEAVAARLARQPAISVPVGISLGKMKTTPLEGAVSDYLDSLAVVYPYGDYFAINISSPNTPGLRTLQEHDWLDALLAESVRYLRERAREEHRVTAKPLLVKVAPDLSDAALDEIVAACLGRGASGLIAVNTTTTWPKLKSKPPKSCVWEGGLSGRLLHERALAVVRSLSNRAGEQLPIIGSGGIFTVDDAQRMLEAGASLLQLYTGLVYEGPGIARRLAKGIGDIRRDPQEPVWAVFREANQQQSVPSAEKVGPRSCAKSSSAEK